MLFNYIIALLVFVVIYLLERLVLLWLKKKPLPIISYGLLVDAIAYTALTFLLIGIVHIVFKKVDAVGLVWLDIALYFLLKLLSPSSLFFAFKNKKRVCFNHKHALSISFLAVILLECFVFNAQAYSGNKSTVQYTNLVCEDITSNGVIENEQITLSNKQCIYINTKYQDFNNIYLSFDNNDVDLYVNIFEKRDDTEDYVFQRYALIDPKYDAFGYISLEGMDKVESIKIEFDIDDSRYLNNSSKPNIIVTGVSFDSYFPMIVNPLRLGGCLLLLVLCFNFKKAFISNKVNENETIFQKLEKIVLFSGIAFFICFIILALVNNSAYFIKYDQLYLGGTSSNNIYYQQFDAYVKGQLHLDVPVDEKLIALTNPYNPSSRYDVTVLWDHAFYNGKYYSYYGHAPILLVMLPVYWISGYVPSNLFVLQFGVLLSIFAILLAALEIIKLFVKKINGPLLILTLVSIVFGSLLFTNNTYEYGGMIYRIPYAYASAFLFLTIYLFIKGYRSTRFRALFLALAAFSVVFTILSRPIQVLYLVLLIPVVIKMIKEGSIDKEQQFIDYTPAISILFVGAALICAMNYLRFGNVFEFGEHYQLTVNDCRNNKLDIDGVLPTLYHFILQTPEYDKASHLLMYRKTIEHFDTHPYNTYSVGLIFIPITLLMLLIPFVLNKEDSVSFKVFVISSPLVIFIVAFISYCFAGVCPRYLCDFAPWAALTGGLIGLKALEKDNGKHPIVPILLSVVLLASIVLTMQYHFVAFDGLKEGDFYGLYSIYKSVFNRYNI